MKNRIAVTGLGIICSIGENTQTVWNSILNYRSGIGQMKLLKSLHSEILVAEVSFSDLEMKKMLGISPTEYINRTALLGIFAIQQAMKDAQWNNLTTSSRKVFINGTTVGGMEKTEQYYPDFKENEPYIGLHDCGSTTDCIAEKYNFDFTTTISTACSSAANAILMAAELLQTNRADCVIAGGSECLTKFHLNGFNALKILSEKPCQPFDANRAGLNLGEGAAYLVLERESDAKMRNVPILCYLSGYGNSCDAYHYTATSPDGIGAYFAMKSAIEMAQISIKDIDYINAHGTATINNDETEGKAMLRLFGKYLPQFSSTKSYTGHTTSAAGAIEAVISILTLLNNTIPAGLNFSTPIPDLNIYPVQKHESKEITHVLSNSFGFGGNDTSLLFSKI